MDRDRGSIAPLVPIVVLAFFILGGLVVDGTRELNARGEAQAYAEEAARAGATAIDPASATLTLNPVTAGQRVSQYCARIEAAQPGLVEQCELTGITDDTVCGSAMVPIVVNTYVRVQIHTTLLGIVGLSTMTSSGQAKARPYQGTSAADAC